MKKILILLMFISGSAVAQKLPDLGFNKIRVTDGDKTIQAELKPVTSNPDAETDRFYYWYSGNSIHFTQGGFSGRLLNGNYAEYYSNKNLKEQGIFKNGLKNNVWLSWNDNGILIQQITWKNGLKHGMFNLYDDHGNLKQSGSYKNDLLNGQVKIYNGNDSVRMVIYNNGIIKVKKPVPFWGKIYPFKKKDKAPAQKKQK